MGIAITRFFPPHSTAYPNEQEYLIGLRGLFVLESFLWCFLQTFVPAAVKGSQDNTAPTHQITLRKTLSVLLWNESFIYSFFILLSARTICIPFLKDPTDVTIASSVFRRGITLWFPTAVALAITTLAFSQLGLTYLERFKSQTGNSSIAIPYKISNALAYFNSVFNLFWVTRNFASQAGNTAFPAQQLWIVNAIFQQSYTVYMAMVVVPYTRNSWRVKAFLLFIVTAWWVQSWAWYSITGLLIADAVANMGLKEKARHGLRVWRSVRCPSWVLYAVLMIAGWVMQYLWTAWRPQYEQRELSAHTGLYNSGPLNTGYDVTQPQARDDNYLVLLGLFLCVESFEWLQRAFGSRVLVHLGRRSLSWFLVQSIIVYTGGIKLFTHLHFVRRWPFEGVTVLCLAVCLTTVALGAEIFHHLVVYPSRVLAYSAFDWIRK